MSAPIVAGRRYRFRPKPVVSAATFLFVCLTLWLSSWQFDRAAQKRQIEQAYLGSLELPPKDLAGVDFAAGPGALRFLKVAAEGSFAPGESLLVDNRLLRNVPGYWVLDAFLPDGRGAPSALLVARGWIPAGADRSVVPRPPAPPAGRIAISGYLLPDSSGALELSADTVSGNVWQNAKIGPMGDALGRELAPMLLVLDDPGPGLEPIRIEPDFKVLTSVSYAWQWLSFALLAVGLYVGLNLRRAR